MLCIKCGEENPDSAKFCGQCGEECLQDATSQEIREILYKAKEFFDKKEYDKGIECCNSGLRKYSENSLFYNDLAAFYIKKENFKEAKKYCQIALDINSNLKSAKEINNYLRKKEKIGNFEKNVIAFSIFIVVALSISYPVTMWRLKSMAKEDQQKYAREAVVRSEDYKTGFQSGYLCGKEDKDLKRNFLYSCKPEIYSSNENFKQGFYNGYQSGYYNLK